LIRKSLDLKVISRVSKITVFSCCIDKTSSAELSEAINSMFRWYRAATICYAYLSDVDELPFLNRSKWFTRGWTLHELLAPEDVLFYSSNWTLLGSKLKSSDELSRITNINTDVLTTGRFHHINIAVRLSWAAKRQTTRVEDMAYCLMGIVGVNMPLLYGEGKRSFIRLQEEILKVSDDYSIFGWGHLRGSCARADILASQELGRTPRLHGLLTDRAANFTLRNDIKLLEQWTTQVNPVIMRGGVELELPALEICSYMFVAAMPLALEGISDYLCIPLIEWRKGRFARWSQLVVVPKSTCSFNTTSATWLPRRFDIVPPVLNITQAQLEIKCFNVSGIPSLSALLGYQLEDVYCSPNARYLVENGEITLLKPKRGPQAVLFFKRYSAQYMEAFLKQKPDLRSRAKNAYNIYTPDIRNSTRPSFAVVLETDATGCTAALKFFHILNTDTADEDFHLLLKRKARLVQHCMTKNQMISLLAGEDETSVLWKDNNKGHACGWLEHLEEHACLTSWTVGMRIIPRTNTRRQHEKNIRDVFVDVSLKSQWKNLEEKMTTFSIKVYTTEKRREIEKVIIL
jgi:hypothetical protein